MKIDRWYISPLNESWYGSGFKYYLKESILSADRAYCLGDWRYRRYYDGGIGHVYDACGFGSTRDGVFCFPAAFEITNSYPKGYLWDVKRSNHPQRPNYMSSLTLYSSTISSNRIVMNSQTAIEIEDNLNKHRVPDKIEADIMALKIKKQQLESK